MTVNDKIEKYLNEGKIFGSTLAVADCYSRYLIGDKKSALTDLNRIELETSGLADMKASDYNKLFQNLRKDIHTAITKHMGKYT